jgi:hypothetical protein
MRPLLAVPLALIAMAPRMSACSGYNAIIELKNGGFQQLQDVCVLNRVPPLIAVQLDNGTAIRLGFDSVRRIRFLSMVQGPWGADNEVFANVQVLLQNGKEITGRSIFPADYRAEPNPTVVMGNDPTLNGARTSLSFAAVKGVVFQGRSEEEPLLPRSPLFIWGNWRWGW